MIDERARRRLGQCRYTSKQIGLTAWYVDSHDEAEVSETIIHEIAHALTPGDMHGPKWKAKCIELGIEPSRCRNIEKSPPGSYYSMCRDCGRKFVRYRMPQRARVCCGTVLRWFVEVGDNQLSETTHAYSTSTDNVGKLHEQLREERSPKIRKRLRARLRKLGHYGGVACNPKDH